VIIRLKCTVRDDVCYSVKNNVKDGLEYQRKEQRGEIDIGFSMTPESTIKEMFIRSTKFQAMSMDFEAVTCGKLGTAVLRFVSLHSLIVMTWGNLRMISDPCPD
jgi:hypothetical protein